MHKDTLRIPEPCPADWGQMTGDAKKRFCGQCNKHVHNLSAMSEPQARALVKDGQDLCVRYTAHADGRLRHASTKRLRRVALGTALGLALWSGPALAGAIPAQQPADPDEEGLVSWLTKKVRAWFGEGEKEYAVAGMLLVEPPPLLGKIAVPQTEPAKIQPTVIPEVEATLVVK